MRYTFLTSFLILYFLGQSQEKTIIQVKVPNKDDVVYIAGNQSSLGDWDYDEIKMYNVSDYYRMIAVKLDYPAEFKFTRGSLDTEGIHKTLKDNPNFVLKDTLNKVAFRINGWRDEMLKSQMNIGFQFLPFQSKIMEEERTVKVYLPKDYSNDRRYPVIYLTEADEKKFKIVTSTLESLSTSPYNAIPECILVGIQQENVQMELNTNLESSADKFRNFILTELITLIDSKFSTSGFNGIIGHDMGADFNQLLMMKDYNPIKAYINIGPKLNDNLKSDLESFIQNYDDRKIFYFLANAKYSNLEVKESFDFLLNLNQSIDNAKIDFSFEEFSTGEESLFSATIKDGLLHTFKEYRNLNKYSSFEDYANNYNSEMKLTYRIDAKLEPSDINYFASKLIIEKDLEGYNKMIEYIENEQPSISQNEFTFSALDKAKDYYKMKQIDSSLVYWNKALKSYNNSNSNVVNPEDFYLNFKFAVDTYLSNSQPEEAVNFLQRSIKFLPQYKLAFSYYIAKVTSQHDVDKAKGKASLSYCVENFEPNIYFTKDDLKKLVYNFDD